MLEQPPPPDPLEPSGFPGLERYLLPTERRVVAVRRHWTRLSLPGAYALVATAALLWLDHTLPLGVPVARDLLLLGWVALLAWGVWQVLEWRNDWFVVTDRRLLLRTGILTRRVAMMPLIKVTDMSYSRPLLGRVFGYGEFVIESAGHDQALRRIRHLPRPDAMYQEICALMFGPHAPLRRHIP